MNPFYYRPVANTGVFSNTQENAYGVSSLEPEIPVSGFASNEGVMRKRRIGFNNPDVSAKEQVLRVMAASCGLEVMQMIIAFFNQNLISPAISKSPIHMRAAANELLVSVLQNVIVLGYAAMSFDDTGMPYIIPPEVYTPLTRMEYENRFLERMDPLPKWRRELNETHFAIFDNVMLQDLYWNSKIGPPIMIVGNYGMLKNGYPCSPLAELTGLTDLNRVMRHSNIAAAVLSARNEAFFVSGSILSQKSLAGANADIATSIGDVIHDRGTARNSLIKNELNRIKKSEDKMTADIMSTTIKSAPETQQVQFRPPVPLSVARVQTSFYPQEQIARGYGINPSSLHFPENTVRSSHVNLRNAQDQQSSLMHTRGTLKYALELWKFFAQKVSDRFTISDIEGIDIPIPVAVDVVATLLERLKSSALARLMNPLVDVEESDFIEPDEASSSGPPQKKHKKNPALP